jgi:hypothetical protein
MASLLGLGDLDLGNRQLLNARLQLAGSDPTGIEALIYWDSTNKRVRIYDGTTWQTLASGSTFTAEDAQDAVGNILVDSGRVDFTYNDGANTITADIVAASIANSYLATMPTLTLKGNNTGGTAAPLDLTVTQIKTMLAEDHTWISDFDTQVRTSRLDQMAVPTASVNLNSQKIIGLANGTLTTDAISLGQLQAAIEGRQWKDPVATTTTGALPNTPTYNAGAGTLTAGANAALAAQAGHTLAAGERLLVQNQASTFQNGIYTVTAVGSGAAPWVLTRDLDASTAAELSNATVMVEANDSTLTGDNNVYTADGTTLTLAAGQFSVTAGGIGTTQLANNGVDNTKTADMAQSTIKGRAAAAGTGDPTDLSAAQVKTILALASTDLSDSAALTRKYSQDYGNGSLTDVPITHSLGTKDVQVEVRRNSDDKMVLVPWTSTSTTVVTLNHDTAPTTAQYRVVVHA